MSNIKELFGSMVFNDSVMKERLDSKVYKDLQKSIKEDIPLTLDSANKIANAMKDWALSLGVTHYTHWFQPINGYTAEKHDSFLSRFDESGAILEFSGKELVKGEPDASSFPNGGLRSTFEARGYTSWDPSSPAFIKNDTLCIPTVFCSYSGEALDKKAPLLRSLQAINKQAMRILKLFGNNDVKRVHTTVGAEQEYFLIDKALFEKRPDLIYCGRTLLGAQPPRAQEMDDRYFRALNSRISAFMKELDEELWKLGVPAKTEHSEVAPSQYELAPIFENVSLATDNNQLTMELMKKIASKHNMACLLHEKPFAAINGSGKHNNWSMATDTGVNLLEPGDTPHENAQFLLFLVAVIKAVDEHQDLLRICASGAGNDHRLGGNEAPPAIISMFIGQDLAEILYSIEFGEGHLNNKKKTMEIGVHNLPRFFRDSTDRNRTSPFAFTGNKFEFRMPGSYASIAGINTTLNTIVAESLCQFADELENSKTFNSDLDKLIQETIKKHRRIIFNGNSYLEEWVTEAEKRGLCNYSNSVEAFSHYLDEKNIELYEKHGIYSASEMHSRNEVHFDKYCKIVHIEALTMIEMIQKGIIPSTIEYQTKIAKAVIKKDKVSIDSSMEKALLERVSKLANKLDMELKTLEKSLNSKDGITNILELARFYRNTILMKMQDLRTIVDELETLVDASLWRYPSYGDMLYSVV